jgi:SNF2 family DNA or RNA helicase
MLDILANAFDEKSFTYLYLSGKSRNRQELVESFNNDPKVSVFLISLKAGGTGLNLTAADTVIIFDPWWNPSVEAQAADRAHRIGQKKTVNVYRLLTKGTIEEKIQSLKNKKKTLSDALVDSSGQLFNKLTWDDVRGLFE